MTSADHVFAPRSDWWRDELAAALLDARGAVPERDVAWDEFHRRLAARAASRLTRLRPGSRAARWSRVTTSASIAATSALTGVLRRLRERGRNRFPSDSSSR